MINISVLDLYYYVKVSSDFTGFFEPSFSAKVPIGQTEGLYPIIGIAVGQKVGGRAFPRVSFLRQKSGRWVRSVRP